MFILMFVAAGLVLYWYVENEAARASGSRGLLAVKESDEAEAAVGPAYREKKGRVAASRMTGEESALAARLAAQDETAPAFKKSKGGDAYQAKDEARYRSRGPLPRFGERKTPKPKG